MADTIEIDLATLERILHDGLDPTSHSLHSCVPEVSISPMTLAAILADDFGGIDGVVSPPDLGVASIASK